MKALILAAVMALGGTGASALDTNTLLTNGKVIAVFPAGNNFIWISYKEKIYQCLDKKIIKCWLNKNAEVDEG